MIRYLNILSMYSCWSLFLILIIFWRNYMWKDADWTYKGWFQRCTPNTKRSYIYFKEEGRRVWTGKALPRDIWLWAWSKARRISSSHGPLWLWALWLFRLNRCPRVLRAFSTRPTTLSRDARRPSQAPCTGRLSKEFIKIQRHPWKWCFHLGQKHYTGLLWDCVYTSKSS